jgi:hypothetical protein
LNKVRSNFAANVAGQAWVTLTQLLVVPLYIKLLGIEAYGLMGFFFVLQATVQILDLGLGPTLTREIAKRRAMVGGLADARSLVKTVSIAYLDADRPCDRTYSTAFRFAHHPCGKARSPRRGERGDADGRTYPGDVGDQPV